MHFANLVLLAVKVALQQLFVVPVYLGIVFQLQIAFLVVILIV
jgi:hypothetical protein